VINLRQSKVLTSSSDHKDRTREHNIRGRGERESDKKESVECQREVNDFELSVSTNHRMNLKWDCV
jgi:hypothetical protein